MSYIDTSTIIATFDPKDPRRLEAIKALENEPVKIVSELVLAELASVLSRREDLLRQVMHDLKLSREEAIIAILVYILKRFDIKYKTVNKVARYPFLGKIYGPIAEAVELSTHVKLRTLDLLHIAYIKLLINEGENIRKFITLDKEFEKAKEYLDKRINIKLKIIS